MKGHFVAVPGGISHGTIHNQKSGEDCWAHAFTGVIEDVYRKNHGKNINLSPEYDLFWHVYLQVKQHSQKFYSLRKDTESKPLTEKEKKDQEVIDKAYGLSKSRKVDVNQGFQIDIGATGAEAIAKVNFSGVVPRARFDQRISTDDLEQKLERGLGHFVGNYLMKSGNLEKYAAKFNDKDGVNTALFNDLVESLMKHEHFLTEIPLRPDDEFVYNNRKSTPRKFLTEVMQFKSEDYEAILTTPKTQTLALEAVADSIRNYELPVAIGINVFGTDDQWSDQVNAGLFSLKLCKGCKLITGGHEIIVVNYLFKEKINRPTALIVQNSYGRLGNRDINGDIAKSPTEAGFYIITLDYLNNAEADTAWDMLLAKSTLKGNLKYKDLIPE